MFQGIWGRFHPPDTCFRGFGVSFIPDPCFRTSGVCFNLLMLCNQGYLDLLQNSGLVYSICVFYREDDCGYKGMPGILWIIHLIQPQARQRLAALEHPDEATPVSNEPLVSSPSLSHSTPCLILSQFTRGSSPPDDGDPPIAESEAPTEVGSDDFMFVGGKRVPLSSYDPRYDAFINLN
jgi:hypothetical protein